MCCSGAMYGGVPTSDPISVNGLSSSDGGCVRRAETADPLSPGGSVMAALKSSEALPASISSSSELDDDIVEDDDE